MKVQRFGNPIDIDDEELFENLLNEEQDVKPERKTMVTVRKEEKYDSNKIDVSVHIQIINMLIEFKV